MAYLKPELHSNQFAIYAIDKKKNTYYVKEEGSNNSIIVQKYERAYIPITFFDGVTSSNFSIYDENLSVKENSQYSLTFSVAKKINEQINPLFYLMVENRRLRLQTYNQKIDFIITAIAPRITTDNTILSVTCQDVFSYDMSKQNIQSNFEFDKPMNIADLAKEILIIGQVEQQWQIDPTLEENYYADFPTLQQSSQDSTLSTHRMKVSYSVTNSTILNALIELCKKFNANMRVEYADEDDKPGTIYFDNKLNMDKGGYILRPEVNLSSFSVSHNTNNFCSIMRVSGGEDAVGKPIAICPPIPADLQKYFIMLYPHIVSTEEELAFLKETTGDPFLVTSYTQDSTKYLLYKKIQGVFNAINSDYNPWTKLTSAGIKEDFKKFANDNNDLLLFENSSSQEIIDYFNFLEFRSKSASSMFYNFDYYKEHGLMDSETYADIDAIFSQTLRNANIISACISLQYNTLLQEYNLLEDIEEEDIAQLASLDEEKYNYDVDPSKTPESVAIVIQGDGADTGALGRTTIYSMIENERTKVLNHLLNTVWTERYYQLLFSLDGVNGLQQKIDKKTTLLHKQEGLFATNYEKAKRLLDTYAAVGSITIRSTEPVNTKNSVIIQVKEDEKEGYVDLRYSNNNYYIYIGCDKNGADSEAAKLLSFNNAILNKNPSVRSIADWPENQGAKCILYECTTKVNEPSTVTHFKMVVQIPPQNDSLAQELTFEPVVASSLLSRESYLSDTDKTSYANYSLYKSNYKKSLIYIKETPDMTDPQASLTTSNGEIISRKGLYSMYIYYLQEMLKDEGGAYKYKAARAKYSTPFNLTQWMAEARQNQKDIWHEIYKNFGDFIAETSFADDKQISSEGLFMSALQAFSKYNTPTYSYNVTTINPSAIINLENNNVEVGDIVYINDKNVSSKYAGLLKVSMPLENNGNFYELDDHKVIFAMPEDIAYLQGKIKRKLNWKQSPFGIINSENTTDNGCRLYCRKNNENAYRYVYAVEDGKEYAVPLAVMKKDNAKDLPIQRIETHDGIVDVYLKADLSLALNIMENKASIDTISLYTLYSKNEQGVYQKTNLEIFNNIFNIEMCEDIDPIPLQVTGVTQKLREGTSQLTISTDRTMDIVFSRLMKQARL